MIRPLGKPTVTMMPLDLAANDYLKSKSEPIFKKPEVLDQCVEADIAPSFYQTSQSRMTDLDPLSKTGESLRMSMQEA